MAGALVAALAVLCLLPAPLFATPSSAAGAGCNGSVQGAWQTIAAPRFPAVTSLAGQRYPDQITALAIDPGTAGQLFVTDGDAVLRSTDAGCNWTAVFRLPAAPSLSGDPSELDSRITSIAVPALGRGEVLLAVSQQALAGTLPATVSRVIRSVDSGKTWLQASHGLPGSQPAQAAAPCADLAACGLVPSPPDPSIVYYFDPRPVDESLDVFASTDGGRTWARRGAPASQPSGGLAGVLGSSSPSQTSIRELAVDPQDANTVWALLTSGALYHSSDGGRSWALAGTAPDDQAALLDVDHRAGSSPVVTVFGQGTQGSLWRWRSADGGRSFVTAAPEGLTGTPVALARARGTDQLVVTTTSGVFRYDAGADRFADITAAGLTGLDQAQAGSGSDPTFAFRSPTAIALYRQAAAGAAPVVTATGGPLAAIRARLGLTSGGTSTSGTPDQASLLPAGTRLTLPAGQSTVVTYQFRTPASQPPLDLFLLINSADEMKTNNAALATALQSVVRGLVASGVDPQIGLGEYHDLRVRYHLLRDIGPPGPDLAARLAAIGANTGPSGEAGEIGEEANYTALDQLATGTGIANPRQGAPVAPGQQADFRPGSMRVVIDTANEPIEVDPDGPSRDTAVADLVAKGIRHVGLAFTGQGFGGLPVPLPVPGGALPLPLPGPGGPGPGGPGGGGPGGGGPPGGRRFGNLDQQLADLSAATGGVAPVGGVTCGATALRAGDPVVCTVPPQGANLDLVTPLLTMLLSLQHAGPARVHAAATGPVQASVPDLYPSVDLREGHLLDFPVTFSCPLGAPSGSWPVSLTGDVRSLGVAAAQATVECVAPAAAVHFQPPRPALIAAAPASPAAVSVLPIPASSTAAAQGVPVPGAAYAPEEEPQLATADARSNDEHRFSDRRRTADEARWAGEAALSLAAAALLRRRRLPVPALAGRGRR